MCGIVGFQGDFPRELIARMTAAVAHRGPDGSGEAWFPGAPATAFGHRRLAIIDLSPDGLQPMTVACDRCAVAALDQLALVYNGEIYNFRALRRELELAGHRFRSGTDSEVLLHLYAEVGLELPT